jgi:hypothetical protein
MSHIDIEIPQCTTIGLIENLKNDSKKYLKLTLSPLNRVGSKKNFLLRATPKSQKSKGNHTGNYWPNITICSVQIKNDLGWANHFEHKITTKNENPTHRKKFPIPEAQREGLE